MSVQSALDQLANYRAQNTRASQDVFEKGARILQKNVLYQMGDEGTSAHPCTRHHIHDSYVWPAWAFLEQLALAAIDVGRLDVADVRTCSPRIERWLGSHIRTLCQLSTPGMPSDAQRQVSGFTTGRLPHRHPYGSYRNPRDRSQVLCRVVGSGSNQCGMWAGCHRAHVVSSYLPPFKRIWKRRISVLRRTGKIDKAVQELSQYLDTFYTDVEGWLELADIYATCSQYASYL